jgi:hypothetical protein
LSSSHAAVSNVTVTHGLQPGCCYVHNVAGVAKALNCSLKCMIKMEHDADRASALMAAGLKPGRELPHQQGAVHLHKNNRNWRTALLCTKRTPPQKMCCNQNKWRCIIAQTTGHPLHITKRKQLLHAEARPTGCIRHNKQDSAQLQPQAYHITCDTPHSRWSLQQRVVHCSVSALVTNPHLD